MNSNNQCFGQIMTTLPCNHIIKSPTHANFWVENEVLYESYRTIRGMKYRYVMEVKGIANNYFCDDEFIRNIKKKYIIPVN